MFCNLLDFNSIYVSWYLLCFFYYEIFIDSNNDGASLRDIESANGNGNWVE